MLRSWAAVTTAFALVFANNASALWGPPPTPGSSSAWALNVMLDIGGQKSSLLHQVYATGSAPPAYSKSTSKPTYSDTTAFTGGWTLKATGSTLASTAASAGDNTMGVITTTSSASVGSLSTTFSTTKGTALTIAVTKLASKASFTANGTGGVSDQGSTSISKVTINAPAFGINNLAYSGTPAANQVLYHNATNSVVVTANRQTVVTSSGKPVSITVDGVALHLKNFNYSGTTVSGDIAIGTSFAK